MRLLVAQNMRILLQQLIFDSKLSLQIGYEQLFVVIFIFIFVISEFFLYFCVCVFLNCLCFYLIVRVERFGIVRIERRREWL